MEDEDIFGMDYYWYPSIKRKLWLLIKHRKWITRIDIRDEPKWYYPPLYRKLWWFLRYRKWITKIDKSPYIGNQAKDRILSNELIQSILDNTKPITEGYWITGKDTNDKI